jgi:hypothetical protein
MSTSMRSSVVAGLLTLLVAQSVAAAGGWYLLLPPVMIKQNTSMDDPALFQPGQDVSFSKWYRKGAFDSAKECMAAREQLVRDEQASVEMRLKGSDETGKRMARVERINADAAECIASDDRRLTQ